jgi:poly(3-hydroxybutyrate) depolymerase
MKLGCIASILCAFLLSVPAWAKETATRSAFDYDGKSRTYYFFVPDVEGPLPVVLLLHGSGRNGLIMVEAWKKLASKEHFIVVAPDSYDSSNWDYRMDPPEFLHAVVEQVKARHAIDESRIYLFGHSAGACHALLLAILDSRYFVAVAVHAGALVPQNYPLLAYADRRMPIAIWAGSQDSYFPLDIVTATKKEFESHGFHVELSVIPGHDHNYYEISDKVNSMAWDFLKKVQLRRTDAADESQPATR